jgi:hypothetical protein
MDQAAITAQIAAAVAPALKVGAAILVAFALTVVLILHLKNQLEAKIKACVEVNKLRKKNAATQAQFQWAGKETVDESDAEAWVQKMNEGMDADNVNVERAAARTRWYDFYVEQTANYGLTFEQAVDYVDHQEALIDRSLLYVRAGLAADQAIDRARKDYA